MNAVGEQGRGTHAKTQISPGGEKTSPRRNIPGRGGGGGRGGQTPHPLSPPQRWLTAQLAQSAARGWPGQEAVPGSCWGHGNTLYISADLGAQAGSHPASELGNRVLRQGRALHVTSRRTRAASGKAVPCARSAHLPSLRDQQTRPSALCSWEPAHTRQVTGCTIQQPRIPSNWKLVVRVLGYRARIRLPERESPLSAQQLPAAPGQTETNPALQSGCRFASWAPQELAAVAYCFRTPVSLPAK